jgi:hypothetical protein
VHLEYQFAGTTAGAIKQRSIGLYADIARVRPGDRAYFYLLNRGFFGPFRIDPENRGFWWDRLDPTYLQDSLQQRLIYRVRVVADNTYPLGISEWDALDRYLREPDLCLWSLVYRKLKGSRGCTMIFPWEEVFLLSLIRNVNEKSGREVLRFTDNEHITWNSISGEIEIRQGSFPEYSPPHPDHVSLPEDPVNQLRLMSGSEGYLQAFLTKNYGRFSGSEVVFGPTESIRWVGNEVACGLGMQKIDIFVINGRQNDLFFRVIELKKDPPDELTVWQLVRYIEWTIRFIPDANKNNIQPILLCRNLEGQKISSRVLDSFHTFDNLSIALPLKYLECTRESKSNTVVFYEPDLS